MIAETVCSYWCPAAGLGIGDHAYRRRFPTATRIAAFSLPCPDRPGDDRGRRVGWPDTAFSPVAWAGFAGARCPGCCS